MNLLKYPKSYLSLITIGVFVLLVLPSFALAQSDGSSDTGITNYLQGLLWDLLTMIGGFMVWFGGKLINYAVTYYVVGFGNFFIESGLGDSVNSLWSIVRDIFNLTFIFGLVFIGFKLIFGDGSAKRALGTLIMAALLINFSLFITKFVIDFSNIAAAQFASAFLVGTEYNLSEGFMRLFGLNGVFSTGNPLPSTAGWTYIFLTFFLFVVAAFVFIAGGIMLIIRFVVLNIYMILSPVMFLGWVFPGFAGTSKSYWNGFLQRAFFAPAYLLMLYLSHQVLVNMRLSQGASQKLNGVATNNAAAANAAFDQTIPLFLVSIIFLIASLIVAQKMGAQGATSAIAIGKRLTGKAKQVAAGATIGGAAWAGRNTAGKLADKASSSDWLNRKASTSLLGKKALQASRGIAGSSFDARNVAGLGKKYGLGTGATGGYSGVMKKKGEEAVKFAESLNKGKVEKDDFGNYKDIKQAQIIENELKSAKRDSKTKLGKYTEQHTSRNLDLQNNRFASTNLSRERDGISGDLTDLERQKNTLALDPNSTQAEKDAIQAQITAKKEELKNKEAALKAKKDEERKIEADIKKMEAKIADAEKEVKESAESKIIYANQLAYVEKRERDAKFWDWGFEGGLAGAGAGATAAAAVGLGGFGAAAGAVAGAPIALYKKDSHKVAVEALRKKYGKDGMPEQKAKKKKEDLKILKEELESDKEGSDDKKKDGEE